MRAEHLGVDLQADFEGKKGKEERAFGVGFGRGRHLCSGMPKITSCDQLRDCRGLGKILPSEGESEGGKDEIRSAGKS